MNKTIGYEIWFVPTEKGKSAFGWEEKKLVGLYEDKDDAGLDAHILNADDPAPDAREFGSYKVKAVNLTTAPVCDREQP